MASRWKICTWVLLLTAAIVTALLLIAAFLLDPYDTGRSPLTLKPGLRPQGPRTAVASRGRDPAFEAAILGNSHVQLIDPVALRRKTGLSFVSLAVPGTGPKEALAVLDWFLRHRQRPAGALVIGIDEHWCTADALLPTERPFPFWLLSRTMPEYLSGLLRFSALEELPLRAAYLAEREPDRARPDGYWDYAFDFAAQGAAAHRKRQLDLANREEHGGGNINGPFPAAIALDELLARAAPDVPLVLLHPPAYITAQPAPGSEDAKADLACKTAFAALATKRPRTTLVDWRIDRPENREPTYFYDHMHYGHELARLIEADIAAALRTLR